MQGFKNEENARQLVQRELELMKDGIKNLKMGSGGTVCSEASTEMGQGLVLFARPPSLTSRCSSLQGIADECHNKPENGVIGTRPGRNKEHCRGKTL